ncbi:hypothetical protein SKAU_G00306290 [Synaphobranchus kaupii]|uniref:Uncharacterized protein n=1 Tax=Synaphobranchus kaupii TaxID=118154 RepID=A0A9Q1IKX7_SYNKA|nr:hypothetical protein SKAU_G00306290 [Synaphobranchus kaupii]
MGFDLAEHLALGEGLHRQTLQALSFPLRWAPENRACSLSGYTLLHLAELGIDGEVIHSSSELTSSGLLSFAAAIVWLGLVGECGNQRQLLAGPDKCPQPLSRSPELARKDQRCCQRATAEQDEWDRNTCLGSLRSAAELTRESDAGTRRQKHWHVGAAVAQR